MSSTLPNLFHSSLVGAHVLCQFVEYSEVLSSRQEFRFQLCKLLHSYKMGRMKSVQRLLTHFPRMEVVGDAPADGEAFFVGPAVGP